MFGAYPGKRIRLAVAAERARLTGCSVRPNDVLYIQDAFDTKNPDPSEGLYIVRDGRSSSRAILLTVELTL